MADRLLGIPPDQITESEKAQQIQTLRCVQQKKFEERTKGDDSWLDEHYKYEKALNDLEQKYPDLPPETGPVRVVKVDNFGCACPTQLEGKTEDGKEVYARYRHGYLSVRIDDKPYFGKQLNFGEDENHSYEAYLKLRKGDEEKAKSSYESHQMLLKISGGVHSYSGFLSYDELVEATEGWLEWPHYGANDYNE
jgi:hypothetical protein